MKRLLVCTTPWSRYSATSGDSRVRDGTCCVLVRRRHSSPFGSLSLCACLRISNAGDVVPHIPIRTAMYRYKHVGTLVAVKGRRGLALTRQGSEVHDCCDRTQAATCKASVSGGGHPSLEDEGGDAGDTWCRDEHRDDATVSDCASERFRSDTAPNVAVQFQGFTFYVQPPKSRRKSNPLDWVLGIVSHASYLGSTVIVNPFQIHNE
jgi:hypothetical protein